MVWAHGNALAELWVGFWFADWLPPARWFTPILFGTQLNYDRFSASPHSPTQARGFGDRDRTVALAEGAANGSDQDETGRISVLIGQDGKGVEAYQVGHPAGHASTALTALAAISSRGRHVLVETGGVEITARA